MSALRHPRARCTSCGHEVGIKLLGGGYVYRMHGDLRNPGACSGSEQRVPDSERLAGPREKAWSL